jgi:hypothetical protein
LIEAVHKKPLCSNQQRKRTSKTSYKHRLPQARCLRPTHSFSPGLLQQRAGLKVNIRQFSPQSSNRVATRMAALKRRLFSDIAGAIGPSYGERWAECVSL